MNASEIVQLIQTIASLITSIGVIGALVWSVHKLLNKPKENKEEMDSYKEKTQKRMDKFEKELSGIKKEQAIQTKCLLAIMDGLNQLGANGDVTKAKKELSDHLINSAYEDDLK